MPGPVLLLAHPEAAGRLDEIVVMGGSTERGNVTPLAEFNVYTDPEAADIVLGSGLPVTVCGLNVTHQAGVTGRQPNARVAVGLDAGRFWELVVAAVAALG